MISIHTKPIVSLLEIEFEPEITRFKNNLEIDLRNMLGHSDVTESWHGDYINKVIDNRADLISGLPGKLDELKATFDNVKDWEIISHKDHKKFRDRLIETMGYSDRRSDFYPGYFHKIGIRCCVYCNALLTVSVDADTFDKEIKTGTMIRAKFQVDHFIPKNEYPCFAVSLFNLYPVCGPCNNIKSSRKVNFKLYNEKDKTANTSNYRFELKDGCVADYLSSKLDPDLLAIIFKDPDKTDPDIFGEGSLEDTFDIKGIYHTQRDIVEELILKRRIYNDSYKTTLISAFPDLFNQSDLSDRVLLGNYTAAEDIHKRPLAKFMQDIDTFIKSVLPADLIK
jgi:hypothetical protein